MEKYFGFLAVSSAGTIASAVLSFMLQHGLATLCGVATLILSIEGIRFTRLKRKILERDQAAGLTVKARRREEE